MECQTQRLNEVTGLECKRAADRIVVAASTSEDPFPPVVNGDWLKQALTDGLSEAALTVEQLERIEAVTVRELNKLWSKYLKQRMR